MEQTPLQIEVSHVLDKQQVQLIYNQLYEVATQAFKQAEIDSKVNNDLMFSKAELRRFLNNCSDGYVEELIAKGLPHGKLLSDRKTVFSKQQVTAWLLNHE